MLLVFVLVALGIWTSWFAQAPLLHVYWGKVFHIGAAKANLLIALPGLPVTMFLWFGHEKVHTCIGMGAGSFFGCGGLGILVSAILYGPAVANVATASVAAQHVFTVWSIVMVAVTVIWIILARDKSVVGAHERASFGTEFKNVMQTGSPG